MYLSNDGCLKIRLPSKGKRGGEEKVALLPLGDVIAASVPACCLLSSLSHLRRMHDVTRSSLSLARILGLAPPASLPLLCSPLCCLPPSPPSVNPAFHSARLRVESLFRSLVFHSLCIPRINKFRNLRKNFKPILTISPPFLITRNRR